MHDVAEHRPARIDDGANVTSRRGVVVSPVPLARNATDAAEPLAVLAVAFATRAPLNVEPVVSSGEANSTAPRRLLHRIVSP
jgi:hypothetical protein